jgi:ElaB/YqjD/DUF883 family membrane-anchored ribosome-binding protein
MDRQASDLRFELEPKSEGEQKMDEIRGEMAQTRESLVDKLEALQDKVFNTVEQTVETVKETVQTARRTFDLHYQVGQHPWRMFGLAVLTGSALGYLIGKRHDQPVGRAKQDQSRSPGAYSPSISPTAATPGLFAEEWHQLKRMAIGAGMTLLRDWLKEAIPGLTKEIDQLINQTTSKIGGVPIEGPILGTNADQPSHPRAWSAAG